jgi:hypothetical protein
MILYKKPRIVVIVTNENYGTFGKKQNPITLKKPTKRKQCIHITRLCCVVSVATTQCT